jgi:hypothetical protein
MTNLNSLTLYHWIDTPGRAGLSGRGALLLRIFEVQKVDEPSKEVIVPPCYSIWILR